MIIQTQHPVLKPITPDNLEVLTDLLTDEAVTKSYMVPEFSSRDDAMKLSQRLMDLSSREEHRVAGIYLGDDLIGILNQTDARDGFIELGYALLPQYHNRGFATEALRGAIDYCFSLGFREVRAGAFEDNPASIRVMVKSGMHQIPLRERITYRGETHECVFFSITKEDPYAV